MRSASARTTTADLVRRNSEKAQLQDFTERFGNYIRNVKAMRNQMKQAEMPKVPSQLHQVFGFRAADSVDVLHSGYIVHPQQGTTVHLILGQTLEGKRRCQKVPDNLCADGLSAARRLEEEVTAMRSTYEQEISKLQEQLGHTNQTQHGLSHRSDLMATEYQDRLWEMDRDLQKKDEEIEALQLLVAQKESDIQTLKGAAISPSLQLDLAKQELEELRRSIKQAQEGYEEEFCQRIKLQDQVQELTIYIEDLKENDKKLVSEDANNRTVIERLQVEHVRERHHRRVLEARLEELQDILLAKMKELSAFQASNLSLRNELDTLKSMLLEEEKHALGDLEISELDPAGHFVRISNKSPDKEEDIGGFILQQNVHGHPVSLYRFPPKTRILPNTPVTVWASAANVQHRPPVDFLWKDQKTFLTEPQCTTILCTASGHAVAWYTPVHEKGAKSRERYEVCPTAHKIPPPVLIQTEKQRDEERELGGESGKHVLEEVSGDQREPQTPLLLRREKISPSVLSPTSSPWTHSAAVPTHPDFSPGPGHDGRSLCPQSRSLRTNSEPTSGTSGGRNLSTNHRIRTGRGPTRSAGPNSRGVLYLGRSSPAGSVLHKFISNSSYDIRLASQVSLTPTALSNV
ncbi:lamin tail domain-containing protein 1 [Rhinophrynus dorsalis]